MTAAGLDILLFVATFILLLAGFPVAFTLAGAALLFAAIGWWFGAFDGAFLGALPQRVFSTMTNEVLIAVPLFVFMGITLERSRVAEDLIDNMGRLFGRLRGGLGISVMVVGALLAASTGIVGATVITMGLLALPTMLKRGYDPALATGSISAAGTLGQVIPPSIVLVLLGDVISSAHADAQRRLGNWAPDPVSVGDLFAGALLPGLALVGLYILYQIGVAIFRPAAAPALPPEDVKAVSLRRLFAAMLPPVALMVGVLGSILAGIATPTEAAGVGAVGAILLAGLRADGGRPLPIRVGILSIIALLLLTALFDLRIARNEIPDADRIAIGVAFILCAGIAWGVMTGLWRLMRGGTLAEICRGTMEITAMVFVILIGAAFFSLVFRGLGGEETMHGLLSTLPGGAAGAVIAVMIVMFILGFFLDFIEIIFVVVPIVAPVLFYLGVDPIWLGVLMALNLQTSFLTPPFGFALFYLRGVAPAEVRTATIYHGAIPFIVIQVVALVILALYPELATWLPRAALG